MKPMSRVPAAPNKSRFALERWYQQLHANGLLFHPDDHPEDIVSLATGARVFTPEECATLNQSLDLLFETHGDLVYDVALKYFHKAMNIRPESAAA